MYINEVTFSENFRLLKPWTNNSANEKTKMNLERTSSLTYFLSVDRLQKSTGQSIVEIRNPKVKKEFLNYVTDLTVLENTGDIEYQVTDLGEIRKDNNKMSIKANKNFLSTQVSRAAETKSSAPYPKRPPFPLLNLGVGKSGEGVTKHDNWKKNFFEYINFRECRNDTFPLIVFLLRNTTLRHDNDTKTIIREGLERQFTNELVDLLIQNAQFNNFTKEDLSEEMWMLSDLPEDLFKEEDSESIQSHNDDEMLPTCIIDSSVPRNRIIYGAPGTGKSFYLQEETEKYFTDETSWERVTFHSNYTYGQFVGSFKPTPLYKATEAKIYHSDQVTESANQLEPVIDYGFIPGPFLKILVRAFKNPTDCFVLLIEEINRADAAGVFGDIFQLLDRNEQGESEYSITFNSDIMVYLKSQGLVKEKIKLPSNFFIWATMNSADQSVAPMDTAFKRRWSFEYLPLNKNADKATGDVYLPFLKGRSVSWNKLRIAINNQLKDSVPEDKLIGPFFLKTYELNDSNVFKNKLLLYLRDDVLRHNPNKLFIKKLFSEIVEDFENGNEIFIFSLEELTEEEPLSEALTNEEVRSD